MALVRKWEDDISILSDQEIKAYYDALETLKSWELFEREFNGMAEIRRMVSYEHTKRLATKFAKSVL